MTKQRQVFVILLSFAVSLMVSLTTLNPAYYYIFAIPLRNINCAHLGTGP